ncbi:DNA mismatch repair endonuclease MutL [Ruminococcus albus]|uniref:DNA mismatch repair protein MutL n=1 Tax=Ruminococcus albus (strain ATCC 27210 / DSM 20455 / JCM 14654 / NCDO 2250 / 7) TaxID=697329 RepID=E6UAR5_RUMA7|nr:DNA mismatch repair endonuclease MutL [Ruminococcus albus]ADU22487.1 DNA mismatch repair protein MutL [Ruminococcus albus 7 = DSM 20455]
MSEIRVLSREVSELIAAGEVIDRPASVIKELLENAIDAGATVITVEIKNGGRTYMRVTDNGKGLAPDDLPIAFLRHATSKISQKDDLDSIMTLGFRGEALASICAVAKVDVMTKRREDSYGTHYAIEGAEEKISEQCGCPDGTTFIVRDIFYNVPARLKFLKKDSSEANHVADLVTKLTLSHPDISFKLIRDNKNEIITAGDGKIYSSVYSVYGREFANSLIEVDHTWQGIHVYGYTVKPLSAKPNRKFQNFFVNSRFVRSKACAAAIEEAYRNNIMVGKFPACVLYIDVPPNTIDVNVHPTKIEVRFSDEKLIHEAVFFAVKNALMEKDEPGELVLNDSRNFTDHELFDFPPEDKSVQLEFSVEEETLPEADKILNQMSAVESENRSVNATEPVVDDERPLPEPPEKRPFEPKITKVENIPIDEDKRKSGEDLFLAELAEPSPVPVPKIQEKITVEEINKVLQEIPLPEVPAEEEKDDDFHYINDRSFIRSVVREVKKEPEKPKPIVVGELFRTYVVAQVGDEMLLMDKHAAHERYIFEKIKNDISELETQMLLEPVMVMLSYDEFDALAANLDKLSRLGFEIEPDVAPTVAVKGVPIILGDSENPTDIVTELARNFIQCRNNPQLEVFDDLYHSIACKAAIKANDNNSTIELQALLNAVYGNENIRYCPHGRPVIITLSKKDIEKQFRRLV